MTWGTTESFLDYFGLESLDDLPGVQELKATGLLDARPAIAAYGALAGGEGDDARSAADGDQAPDREGSADVVASDLQ
jgi:segregation and condensation protein B